MAGRSGERPQRVLSHALVQACRSLEQLIRRGSVFHKIDGYINQNPLDV